MKLGIVGLPNVGKSTLFNSLTKAGALSANYPFATIDPNVGIVSVPDERIVKLGELYHTKKVTPATIEFVDIAGLVKGASKGEGLGNQFLANIREVDAIVHVVRCFEDTNIIHVDGSVDPARDIETINLELIFSDVEILDRRIAKIAKQARMDKTLAKELELVEAVKAHLEDGKMARTFEVPDDEDAQLWFKGYNLLTAKPTIYAANVSEDDLADDGASNPHVAKVREMAKEEGAEVFVICAQIEQEISRLSTEFLDTLTEVLSGKENAGKFFHTLDVPDESGNVHSWKVEAIDQKIKDFVDSQLQIAEASSSAITSGMGLHPSLSNVMVNGKLASGSELLYAFRLHLLSSVEIASNAILEPINQAIAFNFPGKNLRLGFYHQSLKAEEALSTNDRIKNQ